MRVAVYLPEYHEFEYRALAPLPICGEQFNWVESIETLELWLNRFCGPHWAEWAYSQHDHQTCFEACVAFKQERNKTLFLLRWA
jgi:hypothetical protein